ncbi:MAG: dTDP-4-dehydrorhamnose reductase [Fibrobacterota bacterium]
MIWLLGATGLVGSQVRALFKQQGLRLYDHRVDLNDSAALHAYTRDKDIQYIVNCAAFTAVDAAESHREKAWRINGAVLGDICEIAARHRACVIHLSTDYVFSGAERIPLREDMSPDPLNFYGKSKLEGERRILEAGIDHYIVRISWVFGIYRECFITKMIDKATREEALYAPDDQWGGATSAADIAAFIALLISEKKPEFGIYHFCNTTPVTRFELAEKACALAVEYGVISSAAPVYPVSSHSFKAAALRPGWSYMSGEKAENACNIRIRSWEEALEEFVRDVAREHRE